MRSAARVLAVAAVGTVLFAAVFWTAGYLIFQRAPSDPLRFVDAIVVLGGEHDGREDYGVDLAVQGWAPTVVLSNPYSDDDPVMNRLCAPRPDGVEVLCPRPDPLTTRGEAEMVRTMAARRGWLDIMVVSWRHHLPRARLVFRQCYSSAPGVVSLHAVPRDYDYSPALWGYIYLYQSAAFVKAWAQGSCAPMSPAPAAHADPAGG